jgi:hypothetical protein
VQTFSHVTTPLKAAAVTRTASAKSVLAGKRVTLTAHLPSGATGTVTFFGNPVLTATRTVSNGVAKLTVRIGQTSTFTYIVKRTSAGQYRLRAQTGGGVARALSSGFGSTSSAERRQTPRSRR